MPDNTTPSRSVSNVPSADKRVWTISDRNTPSMGVVHKLGREIVSGEYAPGARLPDEATMLKRYAVSRTALREAYSKLVAKGMLVARPKVGTSVRPSSYWNMFDPDVLTWHLETRPVEEITRDLYSLRRMVEPGAASLAARLRTPDELQEIDAAYKAMQAMANEVEGLVENDLRFHVAILDATHNYFISGFTSLIYAGMLSTFQLSWRGAEATVIKHERLLQHGHVLEAIRAQNPDDARVQMEALIDDSLEDVSEALETKK